MNRKKLELMVESQYFFGIMDKNREKEKERTGRKGETKKEFGNRRKWNRGVFFFGISNREKWKEKEDSFVNKSGILVMEDKS